MKKIVYFFWIALALYQPSYSAAANDINFDEDHYLIYAIGCYLPIPSQFVLGTDSESLYFFLNQDFIDIHRVKGKNISGRISIGDYATLDFSKTPYVLEVVNETGKYTLSKVSILGFEIFFIDDKDKVILIDISWKDESYYKEQLNYCVKHQGK